MVSRLLSTGWIAALLVVAADARPDHHGSVTPAAPAVDCANYNFPARDRDEGTAVKAAAKQLFAQISSDGLTMLTKEVIAMHVEHLNAIETKGVPGMVIECGVALGGSSIILAATKRRERCLHLFDTFEGIPAPTARDDAKSFDEFDFVTTHKPKGWGYGICGRGVSSGMKRHHCVKCDGTDDLCFYKDMLAYDRQMFTKTLGREPDQHNVWYHKGLFNATVKPRGPIAYAHLDGDWYDSIYGVLVDIAPRVSPGGMISFDDVLVYGGAAAAFEDFFGVRVADITSRNESHPFGIITHSKGGLKWQTRYSGGRSQKIFVLRAHPHAESPRAQGPS